MKLFLRVSPGFRWSTFVGGVLLLSFLFAAGVVLWRDGHKLSQEIEQVHYGLLSFSFVIEVTGWLLAVFVWQRVVSRFDVRVPWREHLRIYAYSMLGVAVPGRIWAVAGRVALYERQGVPRLRIVVASMIEYLLIGLAGLLVFGLVAGVSQGGLIWERPIIAAILVVMALLLVQPPLFNRLSAWLLQRSQRLEALPRPMQYRDLMLWLGLESVVILIGGVAVYVLFSSLSTPSPGYFVPIMSAWAAAAIAGNLFFWIPGPVIRDGFMMAILAQIMPTSLAVLFVLIVRVWTVASILTLVGLVWLLSKIGRKMAAYPSQSSL
jgi:hypothetical protein